MVTRRPFQTSCGTHATSAFREWLDPITRPPTAVMMATMRATPTMPSTMRACEDTLAMEDPKWHTLMLTLTQTASEIRKVSGEG